MNLKRTLSVILFTASLPFIASGALAADDGPKIAVLHWQGALLATKGVQDKFQNLKSEFSTEESEVKRAAQEVEKLQKRLKQDGAVMSDKEKVKLAKKLEENLNDYKYLGGKLQKQVNERQQEILMTMRPDLERAVKEIIETGGYDLVVDGQAVLFVNPAHDITAEVTRKLNEIM